MDETRATELRERLGYTRADLLILLNVLGLPEDRAGELPLFPLPADHERRRNIYEFTQARGHYAPVFAWSWRIGKVSAPPGTTSSVIYADDHPAHYRHRTLGDAQKLLYRAIRANEAYIAGKGAPRLALDAIKCFHEKLAELAKAIKSGDWGETPPPDVLGILPSDPPPAAGADVAAKLAELAADVATIKEAVPPLVGAARDADAQGIEAAEAWLDKLDLTEKHRKVYRQYRRGKTQEQIAAALKCDVRTVRRYGEAINAAFAEAGRPGAIVWGHKKSRAEVATKAGWAGGVTYPDDLDDDGAGRGE